MNNLDREIKIFILRALLAANSSPMTDDSLRSAIRNAFQHVAFTAADITNFISSVEQGGLMSGTNDEVFGIMWALTPKGIIRAQQL